MSNESFPRRGSISYPPLRVSWGEAPNSPGHSPVAQVMLGDQLLGTDSPPITAQFVYDAVFAERQYRLEQGELATNAGLAQAFAGLLEAIQKYI